MNPEKIGKLKKFDATEHLETPDDIACLMIFRKAAFEGNHPDPIADALGALDRWRLRI